VNFADKVEVECDFTSLSDSVITIVHHNTEIEMIDSGFEHWAEYVRNVTYFASLEAVRQIKRISTSCEQFLMIECIFSKALELSYWYTIDGTAVPYVYEDKRGNPPCSCSLRDGACDVMGLTE
jgi:hypothetical protein